MNQRQTATILLMLMLVLTAIGCTAKPVNLEQTAVAEAPQMKPDDTWIWLDSNDNGGIRTETFRRYDGETMVLSVTTSEYTRTRIRTKHGNQMYDLKTKGVTANISKPHSGLLMFPFAIGKQWDQTYSTSDETRIAHYEVTAYEWVQVPAGTFAAFKIEGLDRRKNDQIGTSVTFWYAPAAKNIIRCIGKKNDVLVPEWNYELQVYVAGK